LSTEQILIATSDEQQGETLRSHIVAGQARFEASCTKSLHTLRRAMSDGSVSAIIADAKMMPLLAGYSSPGEDNSDRQKPLLLLHQSLHPNRDPSNPCDADPRTHLTNFDFSVID